MEADPDPYSQLFLILLDSAILSDLPYAISMLAGGIVLMVLMLFISASFSASENAFFSLGPAEVSELHQMEDPRAKKVIHLLHHPERSMAGKRLLATILIGNNFINIALVIFSSLFLNQFIDLHSQPVISFLIEVVLITAILVLFGEIIPKIYATQNKMNIAITMAPFLLGFQKVIGPFVSALVKSSSFIDKYADRAQAPVSAADLSQAIELTAAEQSTEDKDILIGLVNFGNITVREIMRVRMDVVGVDISLSNDEVFSLIRKNGYSRMPVYEDNFDQVHGILFIKDLIPYLHLNQEEFRWQDLIREPLFVPEYKKIDQLLKEFQSEHMHMAVVVDEYGGTLGIVTMEDILEEILGEIKDEYDEEDLQYSRLDDETYVFEAKISLNDLCKILDLEHDFFDDLKGDSESLGGVIQEMEKRIPPRGTELQLGHLRMLIESSDKRKINRVKITLPKEENHDQTM